MAFAISQLISSRPYLFHLTAESNLSSILKTRELKCANTLLAEAGLSSQSTQRRSDHFHVSAHNGITLVRDQKPLIEGAIAFEDGWDMARLVEYINRHVFFWPGQKSGPIRSGVNHFERYSSEGPVLLRIPTQDMPHMGLRFSRYNSGAPRCSGGKYSPRGSNTYLPAADFLGTTSEVVEVVVAGTLVLPTTVEISNHPTGPWKSL